jgi:hypothetical protein
VFINITVVGFRYLACRVFVFSLGIVVKNPTFTTST